METAAALMRQVADRCCEAEKVAWTLGHVMVVRPGEVRTQNVLTQLLREHLAGTVAMVRAVPHFELEGGE